MKKQNIPHPACGCPAGIRPDRASPGPGGRSLNWRSSSTGILATAGLAMISRVLSRSRSAGRMIWPRCSSILMRSCWGRRAKRLIRSSSTPIILIPACGRSMPSAPWQMAPNCATREITSEFLSSECAGGKTLDLVVPILGFTVLAMVLGAVIPMLTGKKGR